MSKTCLECKLTLPYDRFHKKNGTKAGYFPRCKDCRCRIEAERSAIKRASIYEAMAVPQAVVDAEREERLLKTWDQIE